MDYIHISMVSPSQMWGLAAFQFYIIINIMFEEVHFSFRKLCWAFFTTFWLYSDQQLVWSINWENRNEMYEDLRPAELLFLALVLHSFYSYSVFLLLQRCFFYYNMREIQDT